MSITKSENDMNGETYLHYGFVLKNTAFVSDRAEAYIPYDENTDVLFTPCKVSGRTVANRIQYQPMEGQDADGRGAPTDETLERYKRLARGGAGTVWVEAVSVCPEGRSNPHQLMLTEGTAPLFTKLVSVIKSECLAKNGFEPVKSSIRTG